AFMVIIWQIKMLWHAGRGHDPSGVKVTTQEQFAVPCKACPQPGINLPNNWEQAPPEFQ
ncbi:hypothetical protein OBBRIDRAFT_730082, partial [Obba rivulosa]